MAIWSFTSERVDKLKEQIAKKKQEHDDLLILSEKDLWCADLDDFLEEWERQLRLDAEIQTDINRMGRRVSKKIGAGRGKKAASRDDDDYDPGAGKKSKPRAKAAPKAAKPETKTHERFAEMFNTKPKAKPKTEDDDDVKSEFSDDDFVAFKAKTATAKKSESAEPSETGGRSRRAATTKPKAWIVDESDDSDGDNLLGDIDEMVKGIKKPEGPPTAKGRLSLFNMSQGGQSSSLPKTKAKPARTFDFSSEDDTNYEMLAKPSPRKSVVDEGGDNDIDQFLSDDGMPPPAKAAAKPAAKPAVKKAAPKPVAPAKRGRPAAAATKAKKGQEKGTLSPAAKAYAKKAARKADSDDEMEVDGKKEEEEEEEVSIAPRRPARAARGAAKAKPKYVVSDDDDDDESFGGGEDSDDPFAMDSD